MRSCKIVLLCTIGGSLAGCGTTAIQPSDQHLQAPSAQEKQTEIPRPLTNRVVLPPPKPASQVETYSVVVTNVPAHEILFALARDAKVNLDIHPGIAGTVTINAVNQTLPQILTRIAKQVDMRYELDNGTLTVMPDSPYLRNYKIDYVNMERDSDGAISNATQVGSNPSGSAAGSTSGSN
ncbi:MAG TPA: STN domain-containing protein, partial [Gallionella sp.]